MRFVDLSAPISQSPAETPDPLRTDIEFSDHTEGALQIEAILGVPSRLLRDGEGWAVETFTRFGTHNSTHVDARWHYNSRIQGERGQTIDELPLDWFFGRGVRVMGIDAWTWDAPLYLQAQAALERNEPGIFWAAHQCDLAYSQIERLVNLGELPPTGFRVACFPLRIEGAGAAPARVVAILPD